MPTTPRGASRPSFDDVRAAFERLGTSDKAAFVLEATFGTIGEAVAETGRRVADAVSTLDLDGLFRDPMRPAPPDAAPPSTPPFDDADEAPARSARSRRNPGVPPGPDGPPAL
ncbi:MAG TPA: hypothetical protein VGB53_04085 [Rubricoccaceae bacterium]|jgi:hypothetical protein